MKLPSLNYLFLTAKTSLFRFPFTLVSAAIATVMAIVLVELDNETGNPFPLINTLLTAALGIPLYFCVSVYTRNEKYHFRTKGLVYFASTAFLLLIYLSLPNADTTHNTSLPYIRYAIFNIIIHLLVSFLPFVKGTNLNGFWNYNKVLFLRIALSALYSAFVFMGLVLALLASDFLFDINVNEDLYAELFFVVAGIFNTWFFVSGIPHELHPLKDETNYPKGLKIFAQYVLLPLLVLYLAILYTYTGKIFLLWDWPKGIVSYLISIVAVLGILTLLLLYPYGHLQGNEWIKKLSRGYYFLLIPLVVVLFIAIGMRVGDYGITINRYAILLLGVWLSMITLYFSLGKTNIKLVPISLATILLLASFGPWSIFSVSERSQVKRLSEILNSHSLIAQSHIKNEVMYIADSLPFIYSPNKQTNQGILSDSLHNEVKSILDYLDDHHGFSKIRPLFTQNIDSFITVAIDSGNYTNEARVYMEAMGLDYTYKYSHSSQNAYFSTKEEKITDVKDYDFIINVDYNDYINGKNQDPFKMDSSLFVLKYNFQPGSSMLLQNETDTLTLELKTMINLLMSHYGKDDRWYDVPAKMMTLTTESNAFKVKMVFLNLTINNSKEIDSAEGRLFLKKK